MNLFLRASVNACLFIVVALCQRIKILLSAQLILPGAFVPTKQQRGLEGGVYFLKVFHMLQYSRQAQ